VPDGPGAAPVIIMAHGLGAIRGMRLDTYAERFCAAGYACLVFDYRHFGDSDGAPRQLLDINRQLDDWAAAISFARNLDSIDHRRIILWGTSFGGGHVIIAAARDPQIAAVVSQCPFTDGPASVRTMPIRSAAALTVLGMRDIAGALRGRSPVMVPTAGRPGTVALMSTADAESGYLALVPPASPFHNEVAARVALQVPLHRPGRHASAVNCPILFCVCESDSVAPAATTLRHARMAPKGEISLYPHGHFDIYVGEPFERVVSDQIRFLRAHVPPAGHA